MLAKKKKKSTARPRRGRVSTEVGPTVSIGLHRISDITGTVHTKPPSAFGQAVVWRQLRVC